jgi:actin-like ATPase involved in cell morphogenesis
LVLTGGGALLRDLDKLWRRKPAPVIVALNPLRPGGSRRQ